MKRRESIQRLERLGAVFVRHGGSHDWYQSPKTGMAQPVHRDAEINELLAKSILKKLGDSRNY